MPLRHFTSRFRFSTITQQVGRAKAQISRLKICRVIQVLTTLRIPLVHVSHPTSRNPLMEAMSNSKRVSCWGGKVRVAQLSCLATRILRSKSLRNRRRSRTMTFPSSTATKSKAHLSSRNMDTTDTEATAVTGRASVALTPLLTCSSTSFQTQARCPTKTALSLLMVKEWASTATNLIISIMCSTIVVIIIKEVEVIEVAQCTLDTVISIDTSIRTTRCTRRTAGIVDTVEVVPREDVAREGSITAIIITTISMETVECITRSTTTAILDTRTSMIEVESNITGTTRTMAVARCTDEAEEAITNKSTTSSITTNTATRTPMTSIRCQWEETTRCSHSKIITLKRTTPRSIPARSNSGNRSTEVILRRSRTRHEIITRTTISTPDSNRVATRCRINSRATRNLPTMARTTTKTNGITSSSSRIRISTTTGSIRCNTTRQVGQCHRM